MAEITPRRWRLIRTILSILFICCILLASENYDIISRLQHEVSTLHGSFHQTMSTSKKKAILCTVIKDVELLYIDEWADYHMALGFTSLRLYDNSDSFTMNNWGRDKSYASQIERIHFLPGVTHNISQSMGGASKLQSTAFMDCVSYAKENNIDWVAAFDLDEFLVLRSAPFSIVDFMDQYCQYPCGQISFNWLMFGSNNRSKYVPVPVTKRFPYRTPSAKWEIVCKGIADPKAIGDFWMHTFQLNSSRTWLDTSGMVVATKSLKMLINDRKPQDVAVLHHYKTLSEGEWHDKNCIRKDVNNYGMKCGTTANSILPMKDGMIYDDSAWQILRTLVPDYEIYDKLGVEDLG